LLNLASDEAEGGDQDKVVSIVRLANDADAAAPAEPGAELPTDIPNE
jgi:hypothetical protein